MSQFPQLKVRSADISDMSRARTLKRDLGALKKEIIKYAPPGYDIRKIDRLRLRVFRFPRSECYGELYIASGNRRYVCVNSSVLNSGYYKSLEYMIHGIAHSFCFLKDEIAEESFCEFVSYSVLKKVLERKGTRFSRRIMKGIMNYSTKDYNSFFRAARKLERKEEGTMMRLNARAKSRKLSKKDQKNIFYKLVKMKNPGEEMSDTVPEMEKGFRRV